MSPIGCGGAKASASYNTSHKGSRFMIEQIGDQPRLLGLAHFAHVEDGGERFAGEQPQRGYKRR